MSTYLISAFDIDLARDLFLIAGPCVIESRDHAFFMAAELKKITAAHHMPFVFKASYDKANRTSIRSFRGVGLKEGLRILSDVREKLEIPILSDVHEASQCKPAGEILDILQIPAFLCRQTDLILAAAATGKIVNVKKGQFLAPWDMKNVVEKMRESGNERVLLTERGASFGYNSLVVDFRSFPIMQSFGCPVVFDVTHSLQLPGGQGQSSGGEPQYIPHLARAGVAAGVDGLFMEVHENPAKALSDGPNALNLSLLPALLEQLLEIRKCLKKTSRL
ncbi:MAG: 3-deoxy-8-phosphooctulonate synthase [Acidobacteria bacterium]|nr:MAG: 3-deoxy-8-phosphooctulonate synthase [Acidobacteriota bacterium]